MLQNVDCFVLACHQSGWLQRTSSALPSVGSLFSPFPNPSSIGFPPHSPALRDALVWSSVQKAGVPLLLQLLTLLQLCMIEPIENTETVIEQRRKQRTLLNKIPRGQKDGLLAGGSVPALCPLHGPELLRLELALWWGHEGKRILKTMQTPPHSLA